MNAEKIKMRAIMNYSVAILAEIVTIADSNNIPLYNGEKCVRLSDVEMAINKYLPGNDGYFSLEN